MSSEAKISVTRSSGRIPNLKSRGRINRQKLLQAAKKLLGSKDKSSVRFNDIFRAAGVSRGSAYRIYDGTDDLMQDLVCEWIAGYAAMIKEAHTNIRPATWIELTDSIIAISAEGWSESVGTLIAAPRHDTLVPDSYKEAMRDLMKTFAEIYNRYFEVPYIPGWLSVLGVGLQLSYTIFANAMRKEGKISAECVVEAQQVSRTYLALHLPKTLPVRIS